MLGSNLTDLTIRSLAAPLGNRIEVWDSKIPGFGVRVSPIGTKTFVLFYHFNGRKIRQSLGRFPHIKLAEARAKAHAILGQVSDGTDPRQHDTHSSNKLRFEHVVEEFIAKHCAVHNRKSTAKETARLLRVRFARQWAARDIRQIGRRDIVAILDDAMNSNTPSAANHAFSAVSKLFSWCVARGIIETNPCLGTSRPAPAKERSRVLLDEELSAIWHAADHVGFPMGPITELLILTGQRRGEVAGMRWQEIDFDRATWSIPSERTKNKRPHTIPLAPFAIAIIRALPRINDRLVFPARGSETEIVSGYSKLKPKLEALANVNDWTLHDLRRTAATGLARLGVAPHVVERILNHTSGTFAGVAGVYNRFGYLDEMRAALEVWERHVSSVIDKGFASTRSANTIP